MKTIDAVVREFGLTIKNLENELAFRKASCCNLHPCLKNFSYKQISDEINFLKSLLAQPPKNEKIIKRELPYIDWGSKSDECELSF